MPEIPKLKRVQRLDSAPVKGQFTSEGYLVDCPIVTSIGIFEYINPDGSTRKELRLPEHVFDEESLATYEGKPVIITHGAGRVTNQNVSDEIVGTILSPGMQDGDDVRAKIIIHDTDSLKRSGKRELSLGYDLVLDETPGVWNGQPYDAIQTDIKVNHLALVGEARAGEQARLNIDGKQNLTGGKTMAKKTKAMTPGELKSKLSNARRSRRLDEDDETKEVAEFEEKKDGLDDLDPEEGDGETATEDRLSVIRGNKDRRDAENEGAESLKEVVAQQDADIGELLEIIDQLKAEQDFNAANGDSEDESKEDGDDDENTDGDDEEKGLNADSVDRVVRERVKLVRIGDKLHMDGLEDMRPLEAKKAIIRKVTPSLRLDGKSNAYIRAAFDLAVDQINARKDTDYQRKQMTSRNDGASAPRTGKTSAQIARERAIERRMNGGKE